MSSEQPPPLDGAWSAWGTWQRAMYGSDEWGADQRGGGVALTVAAYLALVLFGAAQGLLGAFYYAVGPVPLAAIGFGVAILATCLLGGWGMRSAAGGLAPAVGWFALVFLLASGTRQGSVLITATKAGEWFLFGGSVFVALGVVTCFAVWSVRSRGRR